ncbi:MAG: Rpn family recombination-promoting nuclease/putative transposase [Saprospiraceae bacterium]|nr:Rpn family recombination-promoting nuclease/putative transposase [Saprospiraceae bacterium]
MKYLDPKNDLVFKRVFGEHPKITISFLNALLPLQPGKEIIEIEFVKTELISELPSLVKNSIVDVRCKDSSGRHFIVEMQMLWTDSFMSRVLFNAAKIYVRQLLKGVKYDGLMPVYALSIINQNFDNSIQDWYHHYLMTNQFHASKIIEGLNLIFVELPKFQSKKLRDKKLTVLWLRYLTEMDKLMHTPEDKILLPPEILEAIELTKESNFTPEQLLAYDKYLDAIRTEASIKADALKKGKAEGEAIGIAKGEAIGLAKGEEIGLAKGEEIGLAKGEEIGRIKAEAETLKSVALRLKKAGTMPTEQIADVTGLSEDEVNLL